MRSSLRNKITAGHAPAGEFTLNCVQACTVRAAPNLFRVIKHFVLAFLIMRRFFLRTKITAGHAPAGEFTLNCVQACTVRAAPVLFRVIKHFVLAFLIMRRFFLRTKITPVYILPPHCVNRVMIFQKFAGHAPINGQHTIKPTLHQPQATHNRPSIGYRQPSLSLVELTPPAHTTSPNGHRASVTSYFSRKRVFLRRRRR